MKINSELERILRAQQQTQTVKTKSADSSTAFEDLLQGAMQKQDATRLDEGISLANLERSPQNMRIEAEDIESKIINDLWNQIMPEVREKILPLAEQILYFWEL